MPAHSRTFGQRLSAPAALVLSLSLSACAGGSSIIDMVSLNEKPQPAVTAAADNQPQTELQRATDYWGKEYQKAPQNAQAAVNYVRNLKALGAKQQALAVIQQAHAANPQHKAVASEYGRLALELDQIAVADKLLALADDPVSPDWKVISARGTVLAKQGRYREAIPQFERALQLSPNQPAVLNNLALAHAMNGQAEKAEPILRQAAADTSADPKVSQNLSLVLGLQGKHEESKSVISRALPSVEAAEDTSYVRQMVGANPAAAQASAETSAEPVTAKITTSAMPKIKGKGKKPAPELDAYQDPSMLVQRLADSYVNTPADAPVQLGPKR